VFYTHYINHMPKRTVFAVGAWDRQADRHTNGGIAASPNAPYTFGDRRGAS